MTIIAKGNQDTLSHKISMIPTLELEPSGDNARLYRPIDEDDSDIRSLADSIRKRGILEPLTVCADMAILSGHRRWTAAQLAGLADVPCRVLDWKSTDDPEQFLKLLREANRQRVKTAGELSQEAVLDVDPETAWLALVDHRVKRAKLDVGEIQIEDKCKRKKISAAKQPFLEAIKSVLEGCKAFWPISGRTIHYRLLNNPPLTHAGKPGSRYANDDRSYRALIDLLTRARLVGEIPFKAISDTTRPVETWSTFKHVGTYIERELDGMFGTYWRDLQQGQPNHVELFAEKLTLSGILRPIAQRYTVPFTVGRGFVSIPPRHAIAQRFKKSGKAKLVLVIVSDFDPEGESIGESLARSMRDDFGIPKVVAVKAALSGEQVKRFKLVSKMKAKRKSSRRKSFVKKHGEHVFEVEALPPETLQRLVDETIRSVLDVDAFNTEVQQERKDAQELAALRRKVLGAMKQ